MVSKLKSVRISISVHFESIANQKRDRILTRRWMDIRFFFFVTSRRPRYDRQDNFFRFYLPCTIDIIQNTPNNSQGLLFWHSDAFIMCVCMCVRYPRFAFKYSARPFSRMKWKYTQQSTRLHKLCLFFVKVDRNFKRLCHDVFLAVRDDMWRLVSRRNKISQYARTLMKYKLHSQNKL